MKGVAGQWALEVKLDGRDLGLDPSLLNNIAVISNIHQHLPSVSFNFKDTTGKELDRLVGDGAQIDISIGIPNNVFSGTFRTSGQPSTDHGGSMNMIGYSGFLDKIGWMKKVVDRAYPGSSSSVISQIAKQAGLKVDVDPTNDVMNWLPNETTLVQYARHVTERAFSSDSSAMILATTLSGTVRYKDLNNLISAGAKAVFSQTGRGFPILGISAKSKSNVANAAQGYGTTSMGVKEDGSIFEGNKVSLKMLSGSNPISSFMQGAIGSLGTRINNFVPLSGNTHDNWFKAMHQNPRIKSSYAFDVSILTDVPTGLELLDTADLHPLNMPSKEEAKALSGKYIVTAITKTIVNNRFFEKLVLTSQAAGGV